MRITATVQFALCSSKGTYPVALLLVLRYRCCLIDRYYRSATFSQVGRYILNHARTLTRWIARIRRTYKAEWQDREGPYDMQNAIHASRAKKTLAWTAQTCIKSSSPTAPNAEDAKLSSEHKTSTISQDTLHNQHRTNSSKVDRVSISTRVVPATSLFNSASAHPKIHGHNFHQESHDHIFLVPSHLSPSMRPRE